MISYQSETLANCIVDVQPLLEQHWQEVGTCPQTHALCVDLALYAAIERVGGLHITTARHATAGLVGYAIYFVQDYPHVQGLRMAQSDALFLAPEHRKGFTGMRLLQAAERALSALGVTMLNQPCTYKYDFGKMLTRMGYKQAECIYRKEL